MAGLKISLLNAATTLAPQDQIPIARNGITLRLPGDAIASKAQFTSLQNFANTRAPLISAERLFTLIGGLSSAIDSVFDYAAENYTPYAYVLAISGFTESFFLTKSSAANTYIPIPKGTLAPLQGQVLTWDVDKWVPKIGVEAIVQAMSGARTLDIAPIGSIMKFAGSQVPVGYLVCNGSSVNKINYPELFAQIGYTYGGTAPGNSFNLPLLPTEAGFINAIKFTQVSGLASVTSATSGFIAKPTNTVQDGMVLTYRANTGNWTAEMPAPFPTLQTTPPIRLVFSCNFTGNPLGQVRNISIPQNTYRITIVLNRINVTANSSMLNIQLRNEDGLIGSKAYYSSSTGNFSEVAPKFAGRPSAYEGFNTEDALTTLDTFKILVGASVTQETIVKVPSTVKKLFGKGTTTIFVDKKITEVKWTDDSDIIITLMRVPGGSWVMSHTGRMGRYGVLGGGSFINPTQKEIIGFDLFTNVPTLQQVRGGRMDVFCETGYQG